MKGRDRRGQIQPSGSRERKHFLLRDHYIKYTVRYKIEQRCDVIYFISGAPEYVYLRVDSDVESHEFPELLVGESELVGVVSTVIEGSISCRDR